LYDSELLNDALLGKLGQSEKVEELGTGHNVVVLDAAALRHLLELGKREGMKLGVHVD
jgi:hypothetical protein